MINKSGVSVSLEEHLPIYFFLLTFHSLSTDRAYLAQPCSQPFAVSIQGSSSCRLQVRATHSSAAARAQSLSDFFILA